MRNQIQLAFTVVNPAGTPDVQGLLLWFFIPAFVAVGLVFAILSMYVWITGSKPPTWLNAVCLVGVPLVVSCVGRHFATV
jgi:hypothetical protein